MLDRATVLIIIDALGDDMATYHRFQPKSMENRRRLRSVLGFSQAALSTIMTGLPPSSHRQWMMYSFAERSSPFGWLDKLPRRATTDRLWVRRLLSWKLERMDRISSYYSIYDIPRDILINLDLPSRRSIFRRGAFDGCRSILDELESGGIPCFVRDYNTPEEEAFDMLETSLAQGREKFHLLYTAALDSDLHRYGCSDDRIGERLRRYGERIDRLASLREDIRFVVVGDHGMCDVSRHVDLMGLVESLGLSVPGDFIPFYDSTMARFRIFSERAGERITELLHDSPHGRILSRDEMENLGVLFEPAVYGEIIFLVEGGSIILPSFMGKRPVAGMHGYHPDLSCMHSALFSNDRIPEDLVDLTGISPYLLDGRAGGGI